MYNDSLRNIDLQIEILSRTNEVYLCIITVRFCGNLLFYHPGESENSSLKDEIYLQLRNLATLFLN